MVIKLNNKKTINLFSQYLKYLVEKLLFFRVVIARFFIILFRKRRDIELLHLDYDKEYLFETSYMVINYRFRNALYYQFGTNKTLEKQIKIFDLKNCDKEIDFVVYGFFDSKTYKLKFEPQLSIENLSFKTTISNLNLKFEQKAIPKLAHSQLYCKIKPLDLKFQNFKLRRQKIKISNTTFNQNEFI